MKFTVKKMVFMAMLTAISLVMFVIEAQLPPLPIPAVKLGIANTVTLFVLFLGGKWRYSDAVFILGMRVLLSGLVCGNLMVLLFSAVGGLFSAFAMILAKQIIIGEKTIPIVSIFGAIFHILGQMTSAVFIYGTSSVLVYLPILLCSAIISGFLTGMCVQLIYRKQPKFINIIKDTD